MILLNYILLFYFHSEPRSQVRKMSERIALIEYCFNQSIIVLDNDENKETDQKHSKFLALIVHQIDHYRTKNFGDKVFDNVTYNTICYDAEHCKHVLTSDWKTDWSSVECLIPHARAIATYYLSDKAVWQFPNWCFGDLTRLKKLQVPFENIPAECSYNMLSPTQSNRLTIESAGEVQQDGPMENKNNFIESRGWISIIPPTPTINNCIRNEWAPYIAETNGHLEVLKWNQKMQRHKI